MTGSTNHEKTTEERVASFMDRLGEQDAEGIGELFADDIDWFVSGSQSLPWTGARSRREEVAEYFHAMWPAFVSGQSSGTLEKVVIGGDDAVVFVTFTHTVSRNGKKFTTPAALHLTVAKGLIVRMHLYEDTLAVYEAFKD
jgi:ketosteroid isomerase-like protein